MKLLLSSRGLFSLCFVILAATNIVVLSGVAWNRSGKAEAQIALTERELQLPYRVHEENSGLMLKLAWRALGKDEHEGNYPDWKTPVWLNADKLEELGFDIKRHLVSNDKINYYKEPYPKEVFIVLEKDGEPYRKAVERAEIIIEKERSIFNSNPGDKRLHENFERAEKRLNREIISQTRLFAIDAGLDPIELRKKHKNRTRFIITKGLVKIGYSYNKKKNEVSGFISRLSVASIYVPLEHRQILDSIISQKKSKKIEFGPPRYEIALAYGRRFEPWVVSVKPMENTTD